MKCIHLFKDSDGTACGLKGLAHPIRGCFDEGFASAMRNWRTTTGVCLKCEKIYMSRKALEEAGK